MDAYQQSLRYMRPPPPPPPPPPAGDHYHQHNPYLQSQQQPQQPRLPVPPQGHQWYPNQFQYQPPSSHSPSPSPPPPLPPSQWALAPTSSAYPPPPPPYPAHHHHHPNNHYPLPPRPHVPPPPPQVAQSYPQVNQDPNWAHNQQSWDYTSHNNVQDWAARAKEWANARAAMENQHMQSQFTSVGRPEEQTRFNDHHQQSAGFHYADSQQQPIPASSYQQFPVPATPMAYQQENASISSGLSSYGPDVHLPFSSRDRVSAGVSAGEANVRFPHQESSHSSPSVHQPEVPSSYSSITGKEETADQKEHMYRSLPMPISSAQEGQPFAYGNQATNPPTDLSDQPLDFAPRFNHDLHMQSSSAHHESAGTVRVVDPAAVVPSVNSWTPPVAPSVVYRPIPPVLPAGPQHDPSIAVASVSVPAAPQFGRFPGQSFQPTIPSASVFGIGAGATLHPTTAFPGDAYGISGVSERPKKAPVPNWLKEEIIKNKAVITKSSLENPKEETLSIEQEGIHKLSGKSDHADSKSIDSSRSTEEEDDDDEDYVEATRTAAINQEIKRILTEVLLKVTDELFDEIATKVLSEDDLSIEDNDNTVSSIHKISPPPPAIPTPKASAKALVPVKAKESEIGGGSEKTSSSSPGDVLGLANYASDDDDGDGDIQTSSVPNSRNNVVQQSTMKKLSEYIHDAAENGSHVKPEEQNGVQTNSQRGLKTSTSVSINNNSGAVSKLSENRADKNACSSDVISVEGDDNESNVDSGKLPDSNNGSKSNETLREKAGMKISANDSSQSSKARMKPIKNDRRESKRSSSGKDSVKEAGIGDRNHRRHDERHSRKEGTDDRNGSRDRTRDEGAKPEEKAKESKSKKRSTDDGKEDGRDAERRHRASTKEGIEKKRERSKEEDTLRHKLTNDSGRHKRRHSSSICNRGRNSKDGSVSHVNDSSDASSDDSKRKRHSRKHNSSPSPVRSKTRQVTRSPHSKHSQRRHSPYSSLETTRGRRSRSRSSPVLRQR